MPTLDFFQIAIWSFHTVIDFLLFYAVSMRVQHHWNKLDDCPPDSLAP